MICSVLPKFDLDGRYSITEAAKILGIHRATMSKYIKENRIPTITSPIATRTRIKGKDIKKFWESVL